MRKKNSETVAEIPGSGGTRGLWVNACIGLVFVLFFKKFTRVRKIRRPPYQVAIQSGDPFDIIE